MVERCINLEKMFLAEKFLSRENRCDAGAFASSMNTSLLSDELCLLRFLLFTSAMSMELAGVPVATIEVFAAFRLEKLLKKLFFSGFFLSKMFRTSWAFKPSVVAVALSVSSFFSFCDDLAAFA